MLRAFIRAMHSRAGERVESREIGVMDALVVVPLVVAILAIGVYPQLPLTRSSGINEGVSSLRAVPASASGGGP
jgi:NADH:ubiquinone oxidoreductase subunit 4 (subunit M)